MKAKLISREMKGWNTELTFEVSSADLDIVPEICELSFKKWHSKRTIDANAKYWKVIGELSAILDTSKIEVHNQMLIDYGAYQLDENGNPIEIILKSGFEYLKSEDMHVQPLGKSKVLDNGKKYDLYYLLKNSSQMDAQEFAKLTDGAISELEGLR